MNSTLTLLTGENSIKNNEATRDLLYFNMHSRHLEYFWSGN